MNFSSTSKEVYKAGRDRLHSIRSILQDTIKGMNLPESTWTVNSYCKWDMCQYLQNMSNIQDYKENIGLNQAHNLQCGKFPSICHYLANNPLHTLYKKW